MSPVPSSRFASACIDAFSLATRLVVPSASHGVDKRERVFRQSVAAPRHLSVGTHEDKAALVQLARLFIVDFYRLEWHLSCRSRFAQRTHARCCRPEGQQNELLAEQVERRLALREPHMRRA